MYRQNIDKKLLCYVVRTKITWIANAAVTASEKSFRQQLKRRNSTSKKSEQHLDLRVPYSITEASNQEFSSFGARLDCALER